METEYDEDLAQLNQHNATRGAQVIQIDNGKYIAVVAICAALSGVSAVMAYVATQEARNASTEYRVLLNHTMKLENKLEALENDHASR